jgi:hypothetical protein
VALPSQEIEKRTAAAVNQAAVVTATQMAPHSCGLFRSQLAIKIFPKKHDNRFTIHPS